MGGGAHVESTTVVMLTPQLPPPPPSTSLPPPHLTWSASSQSARMSVTLQRGLDGVSNHSTTSPSVPSTSATERDSASFTPSVSVMSTAVHFTPCRRKTECRAVGMPWYMSSGKTTRTGALRERRTAEVAAMPEEKEAHTGSAGGGGSAVSLSAIGGVVEPSESLSSPTLRFGRRRVGFHTSISATARSSASLVLLFVLE
mmetsp:Transcript_52518/g.157453  ORF Transcript_52518/g.157453 Transcript_52518/m.157453 type:complete len:200 (-) Transcript_52518:475-1074(-)